MSYTPYLSTGHALGEGGEIVRSLVLHGLSTARSLFATHIVRGLT